MRQRRRGPAPGPDYFYVPGEYVPDGNGAGLSWTTNVTSQVAAVSTVRVKLDLAGEFNGDLYASLRHLTPAGTNLCVLLNRPGRVAKKNTSRAILVIRNTRHRLGADH